MAGYIPEDLIESLRRQADIVEIIGGYVSLKKNGQNYTGLCPFHQEKTSSFVVSPAKQIYHCFGCGKGGNVFSFLMEHDGLSFREAIEKLAARYGIDLPVEESTPEQKRQEARTKRLRQINQWAMEIYEEALTSEVGLPGRMYFEQRGIDKETIRQFHLGFAPDQWSFLAQQLQDKNVEEQELLILGLATKTDRGTLFDKFRGRVIFPILNERDHVTGFGGRVLSQGQPKYLNSQETPLFHKGKGLYGLSAAKNMIRQLDQAVIMEGYMDVIAAHQYGVVNTVASLGTSLTVDQAKLLTAYSYRVLICYDGDTAGTAATLRGLDILDNQGCRAGAIRIPEGSDPDDYLRNNGKEMFLQLTEKAYSSFEYKFLLFTEQFNKEETSGKVAIIQAALPDLAKVKSPVARQGYITMMSDSLQFPESAIRDELRRYFGGYQRDGRTAFAKTPEAAPQGSEAIAQSTVMRSLLHDLNRQKDIEEAGGESLFIHLPAKELYQTLSALIRAGYRDFKEEDLVAIIDREEERHWLTGILLEDDPPGDQEKVYQDSLQTLKRQRLERQIKRVMSELTIAEKGGDASSAKEMMIALSGLAVEKQKLRSF